MTQLSNPIDQIMLKASEALVATDYNTCEKLCTQALSQAVQIEDYDRVGRIMLPLQEARRLRRQQAEDAGVFTLIEPASIETIVERYPAGLLLLLEPAFRIEDERTLYGIAIEKGLPIVPLLINAEMLKDAFMDQHEKRGDRMWRGIGSSDLSADEKLNALLDGLATVGDHEKAHQRAAEAARAALLSKHTD